MIKKAIGVAVGSAITIMAHAEGMDVQIYGLVDYGIAIRSGSSSNVPTLGRKQEFASGIGSGGSRVGIRGSRDVKNDIKAIFEVEAGINIDSASTTGSAGLTNRHAWFGFTGPLGTVVGGRLDGGRASVIKEYDAFQGTGVGNLGSLAEPLTTRADNAVAYVSPAWNGFNVTAAFTNNLIGQELPGNVGDSPVYALIFKYGNGPLSVTYDHEEEWFTDSSLPRIKANMFGASYDFGAVKILGYAERVTMESVSGIPLLDALKDLRTYAIGVIAPVGPDSHVKASWARRNRQFSDDACSKVSIGGQHSVSKEVFFYADYTRINNKSGGSCSVTLYNESRSSDYGTGTDGGGSFSGGTPGGYGTRGFDLGVGYRF